MTKAEIEEAMSHLDAKASALLLGGADDVGLLVGMFDDMPDFKALLDSPYKDEIELAAVRFPGLYRYAEVLTNIAQGIADGSLHVPR